MAATQQSSPPPNLFNIVEHNHNHLKHKSKHGEQGDEEQQEVFDYSHHDDEPPETSCGSSRASLSSSPSHEFSFTVCSLYTSPPSSTTSSNTNNVLKDSFTNTSSSATASSAIATAIDLSPADEIFFHGHLLPLHLLSGGHLSISPRSSTNSLDSFTLPITSNFSNPNNNDSSMDYQAVQDRALDNMEKPKSRSFSLFRNRTTTIKSRKSPENQETEENRSSKPHHDNDHHKNNLNKVKFELTNAIKLVRSLLIFKQGNNNSNNNSGPRKGGIQMRGVHQTFSYSGNLSSPRIRSNKQGAEVLRGRFSAPATTRTSPTNSGMFLEGGSRNNSSSSSSCNSDSTMEELQAAIQAAIAHCKNSSIAAAAAIQDKI
ncbi:unnamed protein product [Rhodiola kirilowii]